MQISKKTMSVLLMPGADYERLTESFDEIVLEPLPLVEGHR